MLEYAFINTGGRIIAAAASILEQMNGFLLPDDGGTGWDYSAVSCTSASV